MQSKNLLQELTENVMLLCVGRTTKNKVISKLRLLRHALWTLFWSSSALKVRLINYRCYWEQHVNTTRQKQVIREKARNKERWEKNWDSRGKPVKSVLGYNCVYREVLIGRSSFFYQIQSCVVIDIPPTNTNAWVNALKKIQGRLMCHYLLQTFKIMQVIREDKLLKPPSLTQLSHSASWPSFWHQDLVSEVSNCHN